jgi:hypothetical protein
VDFAHALGVEQAQASADLRNPNMVRGAPPVGSLRDQRLEHKPFPEAGRAVERLHVHRGRIGKADLLAGGV